MPIILINLNYFFVFWTEKKPDLYTVFHDSLIDWLIDSRASSGFLHVQGTSNADEHKWMQT